MHYQGSCQCGQVAFDVEGEIDSGLACNCSMCSRRASLLWFVPRDKLVLRTPESAQATYKFNKHVIEHHFCPTCGIAPFSEATHPKTGMPTVAVNVRCLPDIDLETLNVQKVDGASF